jgi:hypothetical protein
MYREVSVYTRTKNLLPSAIYRKRVREHVIIVSTVTLWRVLKLRGGGYGHTRAADALACEVLGISDVCPRDDGQP